MSEQYYFINKKIIINHTNELNFQNIPENSDKILFTNKGLIKLPKIPNHIRKIECNSLNLKLIDLLYLEKLKELDCYFNNIKSLKLPDTINSLNCNNNKIIEFNKCPKSIKYININNNLLRKLPDNILECDKLIEIKVNNNKLKKIYNNNIPNNLKYLELNNNKIKKISKKIYKTTNLEISNNKLNNINLLTNNFKLFTSNIIKLIYISMYDNKFIYKFKFYLNKRINILFRNYHEIYDISKFNISYIVINKNQLIFARFNKFIF